MLDDTEPKTPSPSSGDAQTHSNGPTSGNAARAEPPSSLTHPPIPPFPSGRTPIIPFLRRLAFVLSLILGSAAIGSWIWSTFLLPLLHASFSARKVIVDQQKERIESLLQSLKSVRSRRIYAASQINGSSKDQDHVAVIDSTPVAESSADEDRLLPVEESETASQASSRPATNHEPLSMVPLLDLASLSTSLKDLSSALDSTSTTRTSLLSTLEMYTSQLQRDVFLRSSRPNRSIGLNTLSQNLDRERGYSAEEGRSEEWKEARKEIRAMKGILLGRRNFVHALPNGQAR